MSSLKADVNKAVLALHKETLKEWLPLKEIYAKVEEIRGIKNQNNGASIHATLEKHCKLSDVFSGVELYLLKEKGTGLYKSVYYDNLITIQKLERKTSLTRNQLMNLFKISGQQGMMKTNSLDALVLVTSESNGTYVDSKIVNGRINYTGEGLSGDQQIIKNNKTLYYSLEENLNVYLFTKDKNKNYIFEGRVFLCDQPYQVIEKGEDKKLRNVWKFPLQVIDQDDTSFRSDPKLIKLIKEIETYKKTILHIDNNTDLAFVKGPIKLRQYKESSERKHTNRTKKPDYIAEEIIKTQQGIINEEVIYKYELNILEKQNAIIEVQKMKEFFENRKDNEGYDILSFELDANGNYIEKYIEVKSTKGFEDTPIDITDNEVYFAQNHKDHYYIYRVIKSDSSDRYVKVIKGTELFDNYKLVPTMYKIYSV